MNQVEVLVTPIKSLRDRKEYRFIRLANGLKALLIQSDIEANAAVSLLVKVGSLHEPRRVGGLAHFLEHMLFMGGQKYPERNALDNFLSIYRGSSNARTSDEFTCYYFECLDEALLEGFDRFADMFVSPLLSKEAMQKEREAVDSEFQMFVPEYLARIFGILKAVISDSHPASKFDFGNLRTLRDEISDDDLHVALTEFFKLYTADKMVLCIQSEKSLDEQQAMTIEKFSTIPTGVSMQEQPTEFDFHKIVKPEFYSKIFHAKYSLAGPKMIISWLLPPQMGNYKCKPLDYLSYLFNYQGEGGLLSYLKDNNLILDMTCDLMKDGMYYNSHLSIFQLEIDLANYNFEVSERIMKAIFSYLLMIKETSIDEHRRLFEERRTLSEAKFVFQKETSALLTIVGLQNAFLECDDVDVLQMDLITEFNEIAIMDVINKMNEMKLNVLFLHDKFDNYSKKEISYLTEYEEYDFPESYKTLWENRQLDSAFVFPKLNTFIPTNFDVEINEEESPKYPVKIKDDPKFEVWHTLDNKFNLPEVNIEIDVLTPKHLDDAYNFLLMKIFEKIFNYHVKKKLSQAFNAELEGKFEAKHYGCRFSFSGYSEKMLKFVKMLTSEMKNVDDFVNEETFENSKMQLKTSLLEELKTFDTFSEAFLKEIMLHGNHFELELYRLIDQSSFIDVRKFIPKMLQKIKFKILAQGNITREETLKIVNILERNFDFEPHEGNINIKRRCCQLPLGRSIIRVKSLLPNDDNSSLKNIYQIGKRTKKTHTMNKILEAILGSAAYRELRTKHQLGYTADCQIESFGFIECLTVNVTSQENKNKYSFVHEKIEDFIENVATPTINNLSSEEFEKSKEALASELKQEKPSLEEEVKDNWEEIQDDFYVFDKNDVYADIARQLTLEEFKAYYNSFMEPGKQRKLCLQVIGNETSEEDDKNDDLKIEFIAGTDPDGETITDLAAFQQNLFVYPTVDMIE